MPRREEDWKVPTRIIRLAGPLGPVLESQAFVQLARFAVGGLGVTLFAAGVYTAAAMIFDVPPLIANTISYVFGLIVGYAVHSRWSFAADTESEEGGMIARFLMASGCAFALNSFWVWLTTSLLGLSPLAPVPLMIGVTPFASFLLNRYWVFRVA